MHVQSAQVAPVPRFEPRDVERTPAIHSEPATPNDWKRLAQSLKSARPEEFPQMDPALFSEFRHGAIKYAGGRDVWPWLFLGLLVALISWLVVPGVIGPDASLPVGIVMTIVAIAIPSLAAIAHRNLRAQTIAIGWTIGFFKLP